MRICFLHLTMGVINRGSEISTDLIANNLSKNNQILVLGGGDKKSKLYSYKKTYQLNRLHLLAPTNIFEKIRFRLYLDSQSQQIKKFTKSSLVEIKKFNPDIIIPTNGKAQINIIKKHFPNKKIVIFGRAGIGWNDKDNLKTNPDLFISLSQKALEWAEKNKSKKTKVVYIPNPIDTSLFQAPKSIKTKLKKPIVLVVGALTKYKNIDLVIKSVSKTKASLLIMGKGEEELSLKKLAKKYLKGRHEYISSSYEELPKYYKASDVFCFMPDSQEAFGRVYIEAMASGLPIVAPNDSIRKEIIGSQGYFTSHDSNEISKSINEALKVGKLNYSKELEKFSFEKVVEKIEEELREIIQEN